MKNEILSNLDNPEALERLYREDKSTFKREFNALPPDLNDNKLLAFWNVRLNSGREEVAWGNRNDLIFVVGISLIAGLIAKLPALFQIDENFFYPRNVGFILFPVLSAYFAWKNKLSTAKIGLIAATMVVALIYINFLPDVKNSDTLNLSCIHLLLFLWSILGFAFVAEARNNVENRLNYLRYNGDLIVMTTLIGIAGAILSGVTIGLFELIGIQIQNFYFEYVGIFGLAAAPIVGTYLTQTNPQLVGKVSPVIAKIFCPLVLVMLVIYLIAILYSGKDPYNNREFLMIFNALLVGVMAIIFFSIAETRKATSRPAETWILFSLSLVTIVVNGIALSAILFRISEWGLTPNRAAVLGGNVLILINLLLVTAQLFQVLRKKNTITAVGRVIAWYLPIYSLWTVVVTFLFPWIFGFK